ncbi:hypothetical protein PF010_g26716 [Phytophthora fragariae]|uniref:RxLR effector PexRD54 WY domain-containing protein n=2 Tax=Phytophthora fragariae TaxID=53985 RepID=A0A6A3WIC9_9STRA|nr:hypothetical protein PF009_g29136 [Phytophthora fragariae]KAE8990076.1 hypothetical protein PF011_g18500 [Phytophthora fragariae]KAE9069302.1 hypothetical protein PF010_g26716 [Phytophthora fragariae]KAE9083595.1 hypothetical protein PF006_g26660 [Phytophthora fragariae]KAE9176473.1 hypothetical protein PF004_g26078 [Phytophthora fragariae]
MTAAAMKNANTKEIATTLEAAQIKSWLSGAFSPIQIMDTQKLSKAGAGLFDSPQFATWSNYLTAYNKKYPKEQLTVIEAFTKGYGEEGAIKILGSLDDGPGATKFKDEMVKAWMTDLDHPANMFKRLKLNEAGDDLLTSSLLSIWTRYMKAFNEQNPFAETTMIQTLTKSYGDEKLATIIQAGTK